MYIGTVPFLPTDKVMARSTEFQRDEVKLDSSCMVMPATIYLSPLNAVQGLHHLRRLTLTLTA